MLCCLYHLGEMGYREAWALQKRLAARIARGQQPPTLLLLSHPPTYTFGRRGNLAHLLWDEEEVRRHDIAIVWSDRGGDVTYHGPGQVVGYPLLPLGKPERDPEGRWRLPQADYVGYLRRLEDALIMALASWGVAGFRMAGMTGVWVRLPDGRPAKVAAIGVRVDAHGISQHGFALNVHTNPTHWAGIVGCGLQGYAVANLADVLPVSPPAKMVEERLATAFASVFGCVWQAQKDCPPLTGEKSP